MIHFNFFPEKNRNREKIMNVPEKKRAFLAEERRDFAALEADLQIWELIFVFFAERVMK